MSDKQHDSKYSRKYEAKSSRSKTKKSSSSTITSRRSRTPPLPTNSYDMEELLRKRLKLRKELEMLEQSKDKKSSEKRKRRNSDRTTYTSKKHSHSYQEKQPRRDNRTKESSPDNQDMHMDSEDEETIIEQRRIQRKQLLEKFNNGGPLVKHENNEKHTSDLNNKIKDETKTTSLVKTNAYKLGTDMFSENDFEHQKTTGTVDKDQNNAQLTDNWDDADGYYNIRSGDLVNKRYTIKDILGQGVFANVVRAHDIQTNSQVAIKIVRNNEVIYKQSLKEISILKEIGEADPENKYHCVKFITHFMHKGHLCMVLESLHMDLRAVLKKYGKHQGIHMKALISYSRQLLLALRLLKKIGLVHADIKPDNILVNEKKNVLKLCDFGSAGKLDDNEPTPYLVSRFYRAPEIILGIPHNHSIDIWSTACTIYEMATGKIMFKGGSNNGMLKCFMDLKGKISSKMIRKGKFKDQHFNYNNNFLLHKKDEFSGREKVIEICNNIASRDLYKDLQKSCKNLTTGEEKKLMQLKDMLDKMLMLDPNQRASVTDCLRHPFIHEELESK